MLSLLLALSALLASASAGGSIGQDYLFVMNAYLPAGTYCGAQPDVSGWTEEIDIYYPCATSTSQTGFFNPGTGVMTAPIPGFYHCCAAARVASSGVGDFTLNKNIATNIRGGFITRCSGVCEWMSVSLCINVRINVGATFFMVMQSPGSNDCIEETNYRYATLNCYLVNSNQPCEATE